MSYLQILLGFAFLIFVHELGHFAVARWCGVRCPQFAIGFGQALLSWRRGRGVQVGSSQPGIHEEAIAHYAAQGVEIRRPGWAAFSAEELERIRAKGRELGLADKETSWFFGTYRAGLGLSWFGSTDRAYAIRCLEALAKEGRPIAPWKDDFTAAEQDLVVRYMDAKGYGATEYRWNWLPLGGYVKMLGQEDLDPAKRSNDPRAFNTQAAWKRAAILVAGVVMNLVFGAILAAAAFRHGVMSPVSELSWVEPGSPAALAAPVDPAAPVGLKAGDLVTAVDGRAVRDFTDMRKYIALSGRGAALTFDVLRDGRTLRYRVQPQMDATSGMKIIGVASVPVDQVLGEVKPESELGLAGVKSGARWNSVNGDPLKDWAAAMHAVQALQGRAGRFGFGDGDAAKALTLRPLADAEVYQRLGLVPVLAAGDIGPGSPAEKMGMKRGDLIARVEGVDWPTAERMQKLVAEAKGPVAVRVERDGVLVDLPPTAARASGKLAFLGAGTKRLGVQLQPAIGSPRVGAVLPTFTIRPDAEPEPTAAAGANIPAGSRLLSANGDPLAHWNDLPRLLAGEPESLTLEFEPAVGTEPTREKIVLAVPQGLRDRARANFWLPPLEMQSAFQVRQELVKDDNLPAAARTGCRRAGDTVVETYVTLLRLFQGQVSVKNISGVVGIVNIGAQVAKDDPVGRFLFLLAVISVNLAVLNLLPIPILDGGHLLFLAIEKMRGKPMPLKVIEWSFYVGLAFIGTLMLYALWNDITRILLG